MTEFFLFKPGTTKCFPKNKIVKGRIDDFKRLIKWESMRGLKPSIVKPVKNLVGFVMPSLEITLIIMKIYNTDLNFS